MWRGYASAQSRLSIRCLHKQHNTMDLRKLLNLTRKLQNHTILISESVSELFTGDTILLSVLIDLKNAQLHNFRVLMKKQ